MVTIVLECSKRNEWEIKTVNGNVLCHSWQDSETEALEWCHNYMSSFVVWYEIEVIKKR